MVLPKPQNRFAAINAANGQKKSIQVQQAEAKAKLNVEVSQKASENLFEAALKGDLDRAELLISVDKADVNYVEPTSGKTVLHAAVNSENTNLVKVLVSKGAEEVPDKQGHTPLDYAKVSNKSDITEILGNSIVDIYSKGETVSMQSNPMRNFDNDQIEKLREAIKPMKDVGAVVDPTSVTDPTVIGFEPRKRVTAAGIKAKKSSQQR